MKNQVVLFEQRAERGTERGADEVLARANDAPRAIPTTSETNTPRELVEHPTRSTDDPMVDPIWELNEDTAPTEQKRWVGVAMALAATIVVVGVVVLADRDRINVVTDPASPPVPVVTEPAISPTETDPVTPPAAGNTSVWTSVDGITWSRTASDEAVVGGPNNQRMSSVTVGGPGLVAVGGAGLSSPPNDQDAAVWTSVDGLSWSRVTHDEAVFGGDGAQWMTDVAVGGPGLVAVGHGWPDSNAVWTSVDGLTWSRVPHDEAAFGGAGMTSVTAGGPGLVAVGQTDDSGGDADAAVWTSVDGLTWSRVTHDEAVFGGARNQTMIEITTGGPGLVAVGVDGHGAIDNSGDQIPAVWTSIDGITWSRLPAEAIATTGAPDNAMWSVTRGGPGLVAVGSAWPGSIATVWTSVDGLTWSLAPKDSVFDTASMHDVTATDSGLVAVGTSVWTSVDGITWSEATQTDLPSGGVRWGVTTGGPGLVAVGD